MDEGTGGINPARHAGATETPSRGADKAGTVRRASEAHSVIDGGAVIAFCEDRISRMKQPLTAAIYAGLADRVRRGYFDVKGDGDVD